jgi:hypothetical protein
MSLDNKFLFEFKADKHPVGKYYGENKQFSLHQIQTNKTDQIYIFRDGFDDQFGGEKGKKFKYKPFKKLLLENSNIVLTDLDNTLNITFDKWKGSLEQIDDVCAMGIKV